MGDLTKRKAALSDGLSIVMTAARLGTRRRSRGAVLRISRSPDPKFRRPRLRTMRHWITSFRLLTTG